jgi:cellulose synthase/poly-beta-1,6-N-acetylglucosamine synthase-like glycosyltransferase
MMLLFGFALLVAWPMYNLLLIAYSVRDATSVGRRRRRSAAEAAPTGYEPLTYWIIVPCLNEELVVERTVRAALDLAGPLGTVTRVMAIDDGSDDGTPGVLAGIEHPNLYVLRRELPDARRGKGEALNAAYRLIRDQTLAAGDDPHRVAVGVIDGDGRGTANMLREVSHVFRDPRVGAVQCRVRIHNRNHLLGAVQDLEFGCVANASQHLRDTVGTVGLGGNGQYARLSALIVLGDTPWSACLVEDLELGLRMHLEGLRIRYISRANVTQQGLVDVRRLLRQRTRWAQGNLQCIRYVPKLIASRRIPNSALLEMLYYLLSPWVNAVGGIVVAGFWSVAVWRLATGHGHPLLVSSWWQLVGALAAWLTAITAPALLWAALHRMRLRDESFRVVLIAALAYPVFLLLGLVSTWRAIGRQVSGRQTWAKTERIIEEPVTV